MMIEKYIATIALFVSLTLRLTTHLIDHIGELLDRAIAARDEIINGQRVPVQRPEARLQDTTQVLDAIDCGTDVR